LGFGAAQVDKKFFVIHGASGGPFDHVDTVYDYHFTLCGARPPTPLNCMGSPDIFRAPAYQIARKKQDNPDVEEPGTLRNCAAIGSGERGDWTYRLIDKDDPSAGVQIDYTGGQECHKRTVVKTKTETGRDKRVVKWIPTPRTTTIRMTCNPGGPEPSREKKDRDGNVGRLVGETQTVHASEDDMCHYTLTWESPYGCPINKKIRSVSDRRASDPVFTSDSSGFHVRTRGKQGFLSKLLKLLTFVFFCVLGLVGVQMFRHRKWMKIILPQMTDKSRLQQKLARKKFVKLITTLDTKTAKRMAPNGGTRALV